MGSGNVSGDLKLRYVAECGLMGATLKKKSKKTGYQLEAEGCAAGETSSVGSFLRYLAEIAGPSGHPALGHAPRIGIDLLF